MELKPEASFVSYLDERGLSAKAIRVQNLQHFVADINKIAKPILDELDAVFITDPATIISPTYYDSESLKEIIKANLEFWEKINFPTREQIYFRTAGWNSTFFYPRIEIPIEEGLDTAIKTLRTFIEENKPEQLILHPRYTNEFAMTKQISIRAKATPGDTHVLIGKGGTIHVTRMEETQEHYEFDCKNPPANLPEEFKNYASAIEIIVPIADSIIAKYSKLVSDSNLPVYEFKALLHEGKFLLNLFDYEIV